MTHTFYLEGHEYIALCDLLKSCAVADSGGQAKAWISGGRISRNGVAETRKSAKIRAGECIQLGDVRIDVAAGKPDD